MTITEIERTIDGVATTIAEILGTRYLIDIDQREYNWGVESDRWD